MNYRYVAEQVIQLHVVNVVLGGEKKCNGRLQACEDSYALTYGILSLDVYLKLCPRLHC